MIYIDKAKLTQEVIKYANSYREAVKNSTKLPRMNNYIGESIIKIAQNVTNMPCFLGYSYKEDFVGDAVQNVITYLHNFNENISERKNSKSLGLSRKTKKEVKSGKTANAFSYITQICYYSNLRRIAKEQKQTFIRDKIIMSQLENSMLTEDDEIYKDVLSKFQENIIAKEQENLKYSDHDNFYEGDV